MEQKFPFTSYDFWAYLSAGFLLLFVVDHIAGTALLKRDAWSVMQGTVAISAAYAVGHLVASMSSNVFERVLVGRLLGHPHAILFGQVHAAKVFRLLLPGYYQALPIETQHAALQRGVAMGINKVLHGLPG